ncbi:hypothetical protein [Variovorax sp. E3]|uniref:hypothetical protein n=1 Tax=Variovorax sp. E3 TaxID=1914993 RepID=UPI0022B65AFA|nr:hypothetical protein [Variovorax sp. E3]
MTTGPAAHLAAERAARAARDSYGRLLAILSARTHDIAASEDALADASRARSNAGPPTAFRRSPMPGC